MNFQDLQNLVYAWVDDPNHTYFLPVQVQAFLNNAQQETNKYLTDLNDSWYRKCAQTFLIQNQSCYLLPSDFEKVNHMEIITGGTYPNQCKSPMVHSTQAEADRVNYGPSTPCTFFLEKGCIIFRPTPDNVYQVRMTYSYRVTDMIFPTDVPDVPREYQEYIAVLATMDCYLKDQRPVDAFTAKREWYENKMRAAANSRMLDKPRSIVVTQDDGDWGTLF